MGDWHYIFQYVARNPMRGLGIGAVPVADDAVAAAFSIVGKPIRLIADKNYRDHIWDDGSWFDNNWEHTLHPEGK